MVFGTFLLLGKSDWANSFFHWSCIFLLIGFDRSHLILQQLWFFTLQWENPFFQTQTKGLKNFAIAEMIGQLLTLTTHPNGQADWFDVLYIEITLMVKTKKKKSMPGQYIYGFLNFSSLFDTFGSSQVDKLLSCGPNILWTDLNSLVPSLW